MSDSMKRLAFLLILLLINSILVEAVDDIPEYVDRQLEDLDEIEETLLEIGDAVDTTEALGLIDESKKLLLQAKAEYNIGNYETSELRYQQALAKMRELRPIVEDIYEEVPDYSNIIWTSAIIIVVLIIIITIVKYRKAIKRFLTGEKKEEEEEEEVIYFKTKGGEYRTEYY